MRCFGRKVMAAMAVAAAAVASAASASPVVHETYPGLASAGLSYAVLEDLPEGVLLRSGAVEITKGMLQEEIAKAPEKTREQLAKNAFFLLEQMGTRRILLELARQKAPELGLDAAAPEQELLGGYMQHLFGALEVTDQEVADFYEQNKDMCGGATLDQIKDQLRQYVTQQKQQEAAEERLRTLGRDVKIAVSSSWAQEQSVLAKDNPVDKARASGKPSLVDFGAGGCRPCDMMTPILADLTKKYEGKVNVLFVHVREEQILAARYGIQSIPVQVFFDGEGREIFRHQGFFPQEEIEKKFAEMGVK